MSRTFPSLKPSRRSFKLGTFPTRTYRSLAGTTVKRSFGNRPFGYELRLSFANITDAVLTEILDHYTDTSGGFTRFTLPSAIFAGMDATSRAYVQSPGGIRWEYTGPPQVESVYRGISTVSIDLAGEMNV